MSMTEAITPSRLGEFIDYAMEREPEIDYTTKMKALLQTAAREFYLKYAEKPELASAAKTDLVEYFEQLLWAEFEELRG